MKDFKDEMFAILKAKGFKTDCYPLDHFAAMVYKNKGYTLRKVFFYKWSGFFLLTMIPIISTLLSILVSTKNGQPAFLPESVIIPLSLSLTFFTLLNSIFKPSERFSKACLIGIGINRFMIDFLIELQMLKPGDEASLLALFRSKMKAFEEYQVELIGIFLPLEADRPAAKPQNQQGDGNEK